MSGRSTLGNFADPPSATPVIPTTAKLLSTGVDLPTVRNIVLVKPIGSMVDFKQIIGRGPSLYPDEDKLTFDILDYSGATGLFEDPAFDGPPESVAVEEIDEAGEVLTPTEVHEPEPEYGGKEPSEEELEEQATRKLYVEDTAVFVVAEAFYVLDPASGKPKLVEYVD